MVIALEQFTGRVDALRVAAGCFLLRVYFRARHSDMQNMLNFAVDEVQVDGIVEGYIETTTDRTKSATAAILKTMLLPVVAPRRGLSGVDWFMNWQEARIRAGVPKGKGLPTLPYPAPNGWLRQKFCARVVSQGMMCSTLGAIALYPGVPSSGYGGQREDGVVVL